MRNRKYSLGIELSTQSGKAVVLDIDSGKIACTVNIDYDSRFPEYETRGGVLTGTSSDVRHTDLFMLVEALDALFTDLAGQADLSNIHAVKIDAMQHCMVCVNKRFVPRLGRLDPRAGLKEQLQGVFSRLTVPIWEDRSTRAEAEALSGNLDVRTMTGNNAEMRFPAAQIMKWAIQKPEEYRQTTGIYLLSSFLTSLLAGKLAPVDTGDGYGTNLNTVDIHHPDWNSEIAAFVEQYISAPDTLLPKLGTMTHYDDIAGSISPYFSRRYGIPAKAAVLVGTGDNPATLLGCGGQAVISLGSSYTVNGVIEDTDTLPKGYYNLFGYVPGTTMALTCFTNGGKLHDNFLQTYLTGGKKPSGADWKRYQSMFGNLLLSDNELLMLPYLLAETVPPHKAGIERWRFDERDAAVNIRALYVSQALLLKKYSSHLSVPSKLCVVGGQSRDKVFRQLIADAFNASTYTIHNAGSAAPLGCAISGARYILDCTYEEAAQKYVTGKKNSLLKPIAHNVEIINHLLHICAF